MPASGLCTKIRDGAAFTVGAVYDRPEFLRLARSWAVIDRPYSVVIPTFCAKSCGSSSKRPLATWKKPGGARRDGQASSLTLFVICYDFLCHSFVLQTTNPLIYSSFGCGIPDAP
jgi:hypothetical protein